MTSTFNAAAELINNAKLAADGNNKVTFLTQVAELCIRKDPTILSEILPQVLLFQTEKHAVVRRYVCTFVSEALQAVNTLSSDTLEQTVSCLAALVREENANVAKAAVSAWGVLLRTALAAYATHTDDPTYVTAWQEAFEGGSAAVTLGLQHENEGVRITAFRLIQSTVLLYSDAFAPQLPGASSPVTRPLPSHALLAKEAERLLRLLLEFLKQPNLDTVSGVLMVGVIRCLKDIGTKRKDWVGRMLPDLIALTNSMPSVLQSQHRIPSDTPGGRPTFSSIGKELKLTLFAISRTRFDTVTVWQVKIRKALTQLESALTATDAGAGGGADNKSRARPEGDAGDQANKRARKEGDTDVSQGGTEDEIPRVDKAKLLKVRREVYNVIQSNPSPAIIEQLITTLGPVMLAEVVLANLEFLPSKPPKDEEIKLPSSKASTSGPVKVKVEGAAGGTADPSAKAAGSSAAAGTAEGKPPRVARPVRRPPPALPALQPAALSTEELRALRHKAVQRLLNASAATVQTFRKPLLARLASKAPTSDGIADIILEYIMEDYKGRGGHELVMTWLFSLFITHCGAKVDTPATVPEDPDNMEVDEDERVEREPEEAAAEQQQERTPVAEGERGEGDQREPAGEQEEELRPAGEGERGGGSPQQADGEQQKAGTPTGEGDREGGIESAEQEKEHGTDEQQSPRERSPSRVEAVEGEKSSERENNDATGTDAGLANGNEPHAEVEGEREQASLMNTDQPTTRAVPIKEEPMDTDAPVVENAAEPRPATPPPNTPAPEELSTTAPDPGGTPDLSGTPYEEVLLAVLEGLREQLSPKDKSLTNVLLEAPALPMPKVCIFLKDVMRQGGDWATLALSSARDVLMQRPPSRTHVLQLVLEATVDEDADTRNKAVRMVTNQLFVEPFLQQDIHDFALKQLQLLPKRETPLTSESQEPSKDGAKDTPGGEQQATVRVKEEPGGKQKAGSGPAVGEGAEKERAKAEQLCELYMSLCTRSHAMLPDLLKAYATATPSAQAAMDSTAEPLARTIGYSPFLIKLVQAPPPGSLPLLVHMLHVLGEKALTPPPLLAACMDLVKKDDQLELAAAVLPALPRQEVLRLLPRLMRTLTPAVMTKTLKRLTMSPPMPALLTPAEVLSTLLSLDGAKEGINQRTHITVLDGVIQMHEVFTREAVAQAIQQVEDASPLPYLFMRSVIQAMFVHSKLRDFVMNLLSRLITRHIWTMERQWPGFLIIMQRFQPHTFPVFLQLPPQVLEDTLLAKPLGKQLQDFAVKLARYVRGPQCESKPLRAVMDIMDAVLAKMAPPTPSTQSSMKEEAIAAAVNAAGGSPHRAGHRVTEEESGRRRLDMDRRRSRSPGAHVT